MPPSGARGDFSGYNRSWRKGLRCISSPAPFNPPRGIIFIVTREVCEGPPEGVDSRVSIPRRGLSSLLHDPEALLESHHCLKVSIPRRGLSSLLPARKRAAFKAPGLFTFQSPEGDYLHCYPSLFHPDGQKLPPFFPFLALKYHLGGPKWPQKGPFPHFRASPHAPKTGGMLGFLPPPYPISASLRFLLYYL